MNRMNLIRVGAALLLLVLVPERSGATWTLVQCSASQAEDWHAHAEGLRTAAPDSLHFLPKPFPTTPAEVIENLLYQYGRIWQSPSEVPAAELPIYEGVQRRTLRFETIRVENWTTLRCGELEELAFYYLVRIFSVLDNSEVGRAVLTESGFVGEITTSTDKERTESRGNPDRAFAALNETLARVGDEYQVFGSAAQYVTVFSTVRMCEAYAPCIAFRAGGDIYLRAYRGELFRLPPTARRLSTRRELKRPDKMNEEIAKLGLGAHEALVSLGGDAWVVVDRVTPGRRP